MSTKDFHFLLRKESFILCFLLFALTVTQISLGQLAGFSRIEPFLTLNISFFEAIGVILPVLTGIYIYFNFRSKRTQSRRYSWFLPILLTGIIVASFMTISLFSAFLQPEEEPVSPIINNTSSSTTPITYQTTYPITTETKSTHTQSPPVIPEQLDFSSLFQFLIESRDFFLISLLLLPLLFVIIFKRKSKQTADLATSAVSPDDKQEKEYRLKSVLECYYQASTTLEERGANNSSSFTPTEFTSDVVTKSLTSPPLIEKLTNVYEEVKFSTHDISNQQVDLAKSLTSEILGLSSDSKKNIYTDRETEERL